MIPPMQASDNNVPNESWDRSKRSHDLKANILVFYRDNLVLNLVGKIGDFSI